MWNIDQIRQTLINFEYNNMIAFTLANGQESRIETTGTAKTSEEQKSFSSISPEAKQLRDLIATRTTKTSSKLIAELEEIVRVQASTLDKVVFQTEYVNIPKSFEIVQSKVIALLKAYLYPYYCPASSTVESHQFESSRYRSTVQLSFRQQTPSFDLEIVRPTEKVFFRNVRISYPYNLFFPLTAIRNNVRLATNQVLSGSVLSTETCVLNGQQVIKFNGQSMTIPTEHFHPGSKVMVAVDASKFHRFGVLAALYFDSTPKSENMYWGTKIFLKKNTIEVIPTSGLPRVLVNGQPIQIQTAKPVVAHDVVDKSPIATILKTVQRCHCQGPKVQPRGGHDQRQDDPRRPICPVEEQDDWFVRQLPEANRLPDRHFPVRLLQARAGDRFLHDPNCLFLCPISPLV